jgi:ribosomal protein S18 acetylase RimI-like enzyme
MSITLHVIEDAASAAQVRDQVGQVLAAAFADPPYGDGPDDTAASLCRFDRHSRKPGFRLVLAEDTGEAVAVGYGYRLPASTTWWSDVLEPVQPDVTAEDGTRTLAMFELGVTPSRRREGLGTRVHAALIADRPEQRVILNVHHAAAAAQAAYKAWGYRRVTVVIPWDSAPTYDVMLLDLLGDHAS